MKHKLYNQLLEKDKKSKLFYIISFLSLVITLICAYIFIDKSFNDLFIQSSEKNNITNSDLENNPKIVNYTISIVVDDVGINNSALSKLTALPKQVAFAVSPYSSHVIKIIVNAREEGRDTFINIPMQPYNYHYNDPGPYALLDNLPDADNKNRLQMLLNLANGVTGIHFNHREVFTTSTTNLQSIIPIISESKLPIIYYDPDGAKQLIHSISSEKVLIPTLKIDMIVDAELEGTLIRNNFEKLMKKAELYGNAIGTIRPYPLSIDILNEYLPKFAESNIKIISLREVLAMQKQNIENNKSNQEG